MRARDLAEAFPIVTPDTDAMVAARAMAGQRLPGLIVCDDDGQPVHDSAGLPGPALPDPRLYPG